MENRKSENFLKKFFVKWSAAKRKENFGINILS